MGGVMKGNMENLLTNQFYVDIMHPSSREITELHELPKTWTSANEKLGYGIVKGVSKAEVWANNTVNSWQLPPEHPRNNKSNCVKLAKAAGRSPIKIYDTEKDLVPFYVLTGKNAFILDSGIGSISCGYFQALEACETIFKFIGKRWWSRCNDQLSKSKLSWIDMFHNNTNKSSYCAEKGSHVPFHETVFVMSAAWDNNYHHFMIDGLSKMIRMIDFLHQHPNIKIHIRKGEQNFKKKPLQYAAAIAMRRRLFHLLGIDENRLISGPILAKQVILTRGIKCNYPIAHALEIRELSRYFLLASHPELVSHTILTNADNRNKLALFGEKGLLTRPSQERKNLIIQHRHCETDTTCKHWREWPLYLLRVFETQFKELFPNHNVITISSGNKNWTECVACQIREYAKADILIGLHGAGLTNMIFMPPNSLLMEIMGQFDGRMLPLCGYHGSLAASFGVHHALHYYDWKGNEQLNAREVAKQTLAFYSILHHT